VAKCKVICVEFLSDVARQELLKSANAAWSYSKNKSGTFFVDHGVCTALLVQDPFCPWWLCGGLLIGWSLAELSVVLLSSNSSVRSNMPSSTSIGHFQFID